MPTYTDDELIARAIANGWEQLIEVTDRFPGSAKYPWTGWLVKPYGPGIPVYPGVERERWVGDWGKDRRKETYVDSWATVPRETFDHDDRCNDCGNLIEYGRMSGYEIERRPLPFCWACKFWLDRLPVDGNVMIVDNGTARTFYSLGPRRSPSQFNGHSGRWFTFNTTNGRTLRSCDVWCGGDIPDRFLDRFPVNAEMAGG